MTTVEVLYRYNAAPIEAAMVALNNLRDVYGIRRIDFNEKEKSVRVEYDATRFDTPVVAQMLRRCGIQVVEQVALSQPAPPPPPPAPPAQPPAK